MRRDHPSVVRLLFDCSFDSRGRPLQAREGRRPHGMTEEQQRGPVGGPDGSTRTERSNVRQAGLLPGRPRPRPPSPPPEALPTLPAPTLRP